MTRISANDVAVIHRGGTVATACKLPRLPIFDTNPQTSYCGVIPIQAVCRMCKANVESTDAIVMCPTCGGVDLDLTAGDELILESIEYDDPTARRS